MKGSHVSKTVSGTIPDDNGKHWLESFEAFMEYSWVKNLRPDFTRDAALASAACRQVVQDLTVLNKLYDQEHTRAAFTAIEGRVKKEDSFFRKLYGLCLEYKGVVSKQILTDLYKSITDLCGVRFSCPYVDEVKPAIEEQVRQWLNRRNYNTDLRSHGHADKDLLENGDKLGYRSYHFFIEVPTPCDIFGDIQPCICEVQARSELQHVWASRSHEEFYKPGGELRFSDKHVLEDMKNISDMLNSADKYLVSVRDRIQKRKGGAS